MGFGESGSDSAGRIVEVGPGGIAANSPRVNRKLNSSAAGTAKSVSRPYGLRLFCALPETPGYWQSALRDWESTTFAPG